MRQISVCPICHRYSFQTLYESTDRMFHIPGKFSVLKCNNCSIAFLNPRPSFRELQKYYPTKRYYAYNENKKGFFSFIREYLIKHYYAPTIVSKIISVFISNVPAMPTWKNSGKILDVGCGTGETLQLLKMKGEEPWVLGKIVSRGK